MSETSPLTSNDQAVYVIPFTELRMKDVPSVGGKNASLGEMISQMKEKGCLLYTSMWKFRTKGMVDGQLAVEAELMCAIRGGVVAQKVEA